ncbi:MAG: diaminopimelate decarboxylase [Thiotrichaceae bacterium]|nr:diaminopimelate decarboxylase [Thiotrichaceae bacterium]
MDHFNYRNKQLHAEETAISTIAEKYGSPCYIYSRSTLERHWNAFNDAFGNHDHLVCYAVKANSNLAILNLFARMGSGFDIVSLGELERVLAAGAEPSKIVFSGVGKRVDEMQRALEVGIHCFNIESTAEIERLNEVAGAMGKVAPISIRVNPDVDAGTHPYISTGLKENKFGIDIEIAELAYQQANRLPYLNIIGIDCHIGSQLTELAPFSDALDRILLLANKLKASGINIQHLDLGGGLGVTYDNETPPLPADYTKQLFSNPAVKDYKIIIEPGRAITANAGILVTRVEYLKHTEAKNFAIVDTAMNDLIRPALYQAWQAIIPVDNSHDSPSKNYDIVGPICETGDFLGKNRKLTIKQGDLLAIRSSGAYGATMSSNYNSRPRVAEVMVDGEKHYCIKARETIEQLMAGETLLPE